MVFLFLISASVLAVIWMLLLFQLTAEDWKIAAYVKVFDYLEQIKKMRSLQAVSSDEPKGFMRFFSGRNYAKKIAALEKKSQKIREGNFSEVSLFTMPGYVLQRKFDWIAKSKVHKNIYKAVFETYGRKHAENKTKQVLASMLSYPLIGLALTFALDSLFLAMQNPNALLILVVGVLLVLILTYAVYDEVGSKMTKRREEIVRHFPNMLSKFALLVTSGMIVDRAWRQTANSGMSALYVEMQMTSKELENLVDPMDAYGNFIARCNTKETTKFASAIMQNMSKGNAEIGILLKAMAKEAWFERKHSAKKNSEKANTRLLIPTLLLFAVVLGMIMVPVAMNFSGF